MLRPFTYVFMLFLLCPAACAPGPDSANPPAAAANREAPALFQILRPDGTVFRVTLEALKTLPLAQLQGADGKLEEGPYLKDVLALAGVTEFQEVTLTGSASPATLTFEQVDEQTILDFNNHATLKLASAYLPKAQWTKDVAEITVR